MATFPTWVKLVPRDGGEMPAPVVVGSEMERGVPKQRRFAADALTAIGVTAVFDNGEQAEKFLDWFYDNTTGAQGGAAWFDFTHPRTGDTEEGQIVNGDIGELRPLGTQAGSRWARQFQIRYVRSTYP